jgi:UDP-N-acetylglucosamine acyltransferase
MLHQFNRVGRFAFVSGGATLSCDVPPFCIAEGRNRLAGINLVGLRRGGFSREHISALRHAFRQLFRNPVPRDEMIRVLQEGGQHCPPLLEMAEFVGGVKRSLAVGVGRPPRSLAAWMQAFRRGKATLDFADEELEEA